MNVVHSADEAVYRTVQDIMSYGHKIAPRGMGTTELTSYSFVLDNPRNRLVTLRPIRKGYAAGKVAWDLAEREDLEGLLFFNEHGKRFADDGQHVQGENYGQRIAPYMKEAMTILREDNDSRRVWVPIWHGKDMVNPLGKERKSWNHHKVLHPSRESANVPCTIGFGLRIIDRKLTMQVVMRSNAVIGVLPYDIFLLTCFQELIANELGVGLGNYEHTMLSAHVYDREAEAVEAINRWSMTSSIAYAMDPLPYTWSEAREVYALALECSTRGKEFTGHSDPLIDMMLEDAQKILAERSAV